MALGPSEHSVILRLSSLQARCGILQSAGVICQPGHQRLTDKSAELKGKQVKSFEKSGPSGLHIEEGNLLAEQRSENLTE